MWNFFPEFIKFFVLLFSMPLWIENFVKHWSDTRIKLKKIGDLKIFWFKVELKYKNVALKFSKSFSNLWTNAEFYCQFEILNILKIIFSFFFLNFCPYQSPVSNFFYHFLLSTLPSCRSRMGRFHRWWLNSSSRSIPASSLT